MASLLIFNDPHLADNPPASRTDAYRWEGLAMLNEIVRIANAASGIEAVVCTGDMFHVKAPHRTSHQLVGEVIDILRELRCGPIVVAPGNHDMGAAGYDGLARQPLGVLERAGVVDIGNMMVTDHFAVFPVPYNEQYDLDHHLYQPHPQDVRRYMNSHTIVVAAHGSVVPDGTDREFPTIAASKVLRAPIDVLACGHIHEDLGVHEYNGRVFLNLGSLGRTARTRANMTRTVKVAIVGADRSVTELPLSTALPPEKAFKEEAPLVDTDDEGIMEFVAALAADTQFERLELRDFVHKVCDEAAVGPEIEARLLSYLEE